jgi:outer membrane receptor protein involved in Fe transport
MNMKANIQPIVIITLVLTGLFIFKAFPVSGQGKSEEVTIIAPYIPSIQNASKIPLRPEITPREQDNAQFDYQYISKSIPVTTELDPIDPMKFSEDRKEDLFGNYVKGGFGNYTTPYLEFLAGSRQSEKYVFSARLKHHSSQGNIKDYANSAFSHNLVSAYGAAFTKNGTLSGNIGYNRDVVHYYGFPLDSFPDVEISDDDLKQRFQHFNLAVGFEGQSKSKERLTYSLGTDFHFFNDRYETREIQYDLNAGINKRFSSSNKDFRHALGIDMGLEYLGYRDSLVTYSPLIIDFIPVYHFGFGQYSFEVGLKLYFTSSADTAGQRTLQIDEYPHIKAEIEIIEGKLNIYAMVDGNKQVNSFRSLTGFNPFITSTPDIINTDQQIRISGGLTGNAGGFNFNAEVSYSYNKNMALFVNDTSLELQNKFLVIYDDVNLLNIKASIGILKIKGLEAKLTAGLYQYIPKNEEKAWQLPSYEVGLDARYVLKEKFILNGNILVLGTRFAKDFDETGEIAVKLKPAVDLSLGFEYRITPRISAFANVNNILNQHYQRWYNYPVQGIQGMVGASFSF